MHINFSICEHPTEIDARVIITGFDWAYSDSVLIHHSQTNSGKLWNIGISRYGYVYFKRDIFKPYSKIYLCPEIAEKQRMRRFRSSILLFENSVK